MTRKTAEDFYIPGNFFEAWWQGNYNCFKITSKETGRHIDNAASKEDAKSKLAKYDQQVNICQAQGEYHESEHLYTKFSDDGLRHLIFDKSDKKMIGFTWWGDNVVDVLQVLEKELEFY